MLISKPARKRVGTVLRLTELTDKLIILLCCLFLYFLQPDFTVNVVIVLIALIFSGFLSYFDHERSIAALTAGLIICSYFFPELVIFLPVAAYDIVFKKHRYIGLAAVIPWINFAPLASRCTVAVSLVLLILGVLVRYRSEMINRLQDKYYRLNDEAREMSLQLQKQNRDLMKKQDIELHLATLNERNRIAREIHDNVGHLLSSAILQAGALQTVNRDPKVGPLLEDLQATLAQAMDSTRKSVHALYEESIDLKLEIAELVKGFTFCDLNYEYCLGSDPPRKIKYAFIAIVKEALSNIAKHSNASHASIVLREHPALYQLIIRDNGRVEEINQDEGLGLKNMKDRVHSLNGIINITAADGFEIFISVPKEVKAFEDPDN